MKTTKPALLVLAVLLGAWWTAPEDAPDAYVKVQLRDSIFHIPARYSMHGMAPFWLKWIDGLDYSSSAIGFRVPLEELRQAFPGYRRTHEMFAVLFVLTEEELARYHDSHNEYIKYTEMWYGTGLYEGGRIEPLGETGWYRVYNRIFGNSSRSMWRVFRQRPDPTLPLPDEPLSFYVAYCSLTGPDDRTTSCNSYALSDSDRIAIDFSVEEEDLPLIDDLRAFLIAKVLEWKQPS